MQPKSDLPVLKLDSLDPIQAYKSGVLLRRGTPSMTPSNSNQQVLLDLPSDISVEEWDPDVLLKHVELARLEIAGVVKNSWVSQLFAELASLPLVECSPVSQAVDSNDDFSDLPPRPTAPVADVSAAPDFPRPVMFLGDVMPAGPATLGARLAQDIARLTSQQKVSAEPIIEAATVGDVSGVAASFAFANDEIILGAVDLDILEPVAFVEATPIVDTIVSDRILPALELVPLDDAPQAVSETAPEAPVAREVTQLQIDFTSHTAPSLQVQMDVQSPESIDMAIAAIEAIVGRVSTLARAPAADSEFAIPAAPASVEVSSLDDVEATATAAPVALETEQAHAAFIAASASTSDDAAPVVDTAADAEDVPVAVDVAPVAVAVDVAPVAVAVDVAPVNEAVAVVEAAAPETSAQAVVEESAATAAVPEAPVVAEFTQANSVAASAIVEDAAAAVVEVATAAVEPSATIDAAHAQEDVVSSAESADTDAAVEAATCTADGFASLNAPEHTCNKCRDRALLSGEDLVVTEPAGEARTHRGRLRAGQVCENRTGDLVLVGAVGTGAVIRAAGSVHIYGRASGAIKAGQRGDTTARIYVGDFNAQLVDIAGRYQSFETVPEDLKGQTVEIWLENDVLLYQAI